MSKNVRRGGIAAAFVVASAATALALSSGGPVGAAEEGAAADPSASLALLRQAPAARDAIPTAAQGEFQRIAADRQLDLSGARTADVASRFGTVRVIPGEAADTVCLTLPDPVDGNAISCRSTADAEHGRLWTGLVGMPGQDTGDARVAIVVPDGVPSIETVDQRGVRTEQAAHDNVVVADLNDVAAYELTVGGSVVHQRLAGTPGELHQP